MNIKNRLIKLENKSLPTSSGIDIILVKLVGNDQLKEEINHIWSSNGDEYFKNIDETFEGFERRVYTQVRKTNNIVDKCCMLLFGDATSQTL